MSTASATTAATTAVPGTPSLGDFLSQAESTHASQPADTLAALLARAPLLAAEADTAHALRLAEHVALSHLGDAAPLAALLATLPATLSVHPATAAAVQRLRWVQAMAGQVLADQAPAGKPAAAAPPQPMPEVPPDAVRWRALQNLVLALALHRRYAEAGALLAADEAAARGHGSDDAGVAYAVSANNVAMELQTGTPLDAAAPAVPGAPRDPQRDALMLQAAALARRAWGHAGGWRHVERAEYRLALCHATAGQGAAALHHARLCLSGCEAAGAEADTVEHFFAHEALARAHHAAGDLAAARAARAHMAQLLPQIDTADGLRAWCADALAQVPG